MQKLISFFKELIKFILIETILATGIILTLEYSFEFVLCWYGVYLLSLLSFCCFKKAKWKWFLYSAVPLVMYSIIYCFTPSPKYIMDVDPMDYYEKSEKCPLETPFYFEGDCYGCDEPHGMHFESNHEQDFTICTNRESINNVSYLKECPAGKIRHDRECYDCSEFPIYSFFFFSDETEEERNSLCEACHLKYNPENQRCVQK